MDIELHVVVRLLTAAGLGALVGIEREASDQPAGLRTHLSVALGAGLFGVISTIGFDEFRAGQRDVNIQFDVTRVASTVVTGIGFLGAGVIFRRGSTVHNLTTAASLWVVAAVGLACGVGDIGPAVVVTVVLLVGLVVLRFPRDWIRDHLAKDDVSVRLELVPGADEEPVVGALRAVDGVRVDRVALAKHEGAYVVAARVRAVAGSFQVRPRLGALARRPDVHSLEVTGNQ